MIDKRLSDPFGVPATGRVDQDEEADLEEYDSLRGRTNSNERGSSEDRRRRKLWLMEVYRADADLLNDEEVTRGSGEPVVRCYRCGELQTADEVIVSRIIPSIRGGSYTRTNLRPCCPACAHILSQEIGVTQRTLTAST